MLDGHAPHRLRRRGTARRSDRASLRRGSTARTDDAPVEDITLTRFETADQCRLGQRRLGRRDGRVRRCPAQSAGSRCPTRMAGAGRSPPSSGSPFTAGVAEAKRWGCRSKTASDHSSPTWPMRSTRADPRSPMVRQGAHILEATLAVYASRCDGQDVVAAPRPWRAGLRARASPVWPNLTCLHRARSGRSGSSASADHRSPAWIWASTPIRSRSCRSRGRWTSPSKLGCTAIEIAAGGQSSAPHMRIDDLLADADKRRAFADAFAEPRPADRRIELLRLAAPPGQGAGRRRVDPQGHPAGRRAGRRQDRDDVRQPGRWSRFHHHQLGLVSVAARCGRPARAPVGRGDPVLAGDGPLRG